MVPGSRLIVSCQLSSFKLAARHRHNWVRFEIYLMPRARKHDGKARWARRTGMPSHSHFRVYLVVALCFVFIFLLLEFQSVSRQSSFSFTRQYAHSRDTLTNGIGNDTLGVSIHLPFNCEIQGTYRNKAIHLLFSTMLT